MHASINVGETERHVVGVEYNVPWSLLTISVDGAVRIRSRIVYRGVTHRFRVGDSEQHEVEIQLRLFRPSRAYVDGKLVAEDLVPAFQAMMITGCLMAVPLGLVLGVAIAQHYSNRVLVQLYERINATEGATIEDLKRLEALKDVSSNEERIGHKREIGVRDERVAEQTARIQRLKQDIDERFSPADLPWRLLRVNQRQAKITVLEQRTDPGNGQGAPQVLTRIRFAEVDDKGQPLGEPKEFEVPDDRIGFYAKIDTLPDEFAQKEKLYSQTTVYIFETIAGANQATADTPRIDSDETVPGVYARSDTPAEDDQRLWAAICKQMGAGKIDLMLLRPGEVYKWTIGPGTEFRMTQDTTALEKPPKP